VNHRKLKLDVEELAVESFETAAARRPAGTVYANSGDLSCYETCVGPACPPWIDKTVGCPLSGGFTDCDDCTGFSDCHCGESEIGQIVCGTNDIGC
jgi:hypothetical protein